MGPIHPVWANGPYVKTVCTTSAKGLSPLSVAIVANVWSQAGVVAPKPVYDETTDKSEYHTGVDGFENRLKELHAEEINSMIRQALGIPKPGKPKLLLPGAKDEEAEARQQWAIYEALVPLVESINMSRSVGFDEKLGAVMGLFDTLDSSSRTRHRTHAHGQGEDVGDNKLSLQEFEDGLRSLDISIDSEMCLKAFQTFDVNSNGYLERAEFMEMLGKLEAHALSGNAGSDGVQALVPAS